MHVEDEIIPTLDAGNIVISDWCVQSSLVLQRVDTVDLREIWSYNRYVLQPAISIYRLADSRQPPRRASAPDEVGGHRHSRTRVAALRPGVRLPRPLPATARP